MRIDTRGNIFPECTDVVFEVSNVPEQGSWPSGGSYWKFEFKANIKGEIKDYSENFGGGFLGPILKALEFQELKEEPGVFDFEPTLALGRTIKVSIKHEVAKKGKSAGKTFARMYDFKSSDIPF